MADLFPTDPKRIRERIRRYERDLRRELEAGYGGDGYGKRFFAWTALHVARRRRRRSALVHGFFALKKTLIPSH
jgi:hypothetical protein